MFLNEHLYKTPEWIINDDILRRIEYKGIAERIRGIQDRSLALLFNPDRMTRILENNALDSESYSALNMMEDLVKGIYGELESGENISLYRRNLQRTFIEGLERMIQNERNEYEHSDIPALARGTLNNIKSKIEGAQSTDTMSQYHLDDLAKRIDMVLDPK